MAFDGEIRSDSAVAADQASILTLELGGYCSPFMVSIAGADSAPSSATHDGMASSFASALGNWRLLMEGEAEAMLATGLSFEDADLTTAAALGALGDSSAASRLLGIE